MRVNVYAEEMTDRIEVIGKVIDGQTFTGLRIYLELPVTRTVGGQPVDANTPRDVQTVQLSGPFIHHPGDDSSAVTFWGKRDLRKALFAAIDELDRHYGEKYSG
jgi:hypothetical protein